jgi:hypothetical protein
LFHQPARNPQITNIKPGTLDNWRGLSPVANIWTRSAQSWVVLSDQLLNYPGQPEDFQPLYQRFKEMYAQA